MIHHIDTSYENITIKEHQQSALAWTTFKSWCYQPKQLSYHVFALVNSYTTETFQPLIWWDKVKKKRIYSLIHHIDTSYENITVKEHLQSALVFQRQVQYRVVLHWNLVWSWANIYGSSVGWLKNTRMSTQPIPAIYIGRHQNSTNTIAWISAEPLLYRPWSETWWFWNSIWILLHLY